MERLGAKDAERELDRFEQAIKDLRVKYDQYFFGLERKPPSTERERVNKWILKILNLYLPNTQLRFKRDMLVARFNTYANMWDRILGQIETGTYKPDVFKADMRIGKVDARAVAAKKPDVSSAEEKIERAAPKPAAPEIPEHQRLYKEYVDARKKLGLPTSVTLAGFKDMLKKQVDQIQKNYGYSDIELRVTIEDDKVKIKGSPKK